MESPFHAGIVKQLVETLLDDSGGVTSSAFARRAGVSRQTAHAHLTRLVERGVLERTGKGRATCYLRREEVSSARPSIPSPVSTEASTPEAPGTLWLKVLEQSPTCETRADAHRLVEGLARFPRVLLDFGGIAAVGEAFADELFRVWARAHPEVRLEPVNTLPSVRARLRL